MTIVSDGNVVHLAKMNALTDAQDHSTMRNESEVVVDVGTNTITQTCIDGLGL